MLFFFIALMVIPAMVKLFISQYSIEFYVFSKAAIGALILGEVILLMDWAESKRHASGYPRAVVIAFKTFIYALAVITLGIGERIIHSYRQAGDLRDAVRIIIANAQSRSLPWLCPPDQSARLRLPDYGRDQSDDGRRRPVQAVFQNSCANWYSLAGEEIIVVCSVT